jgi:uncharacterized protein (DUF302 family)
MEALGPTIDLDDGFDDAVAKVTAALGAEGFGVISRIDLDKAFGEKLGITFRRYTILGACNPALAHQAVSAVPEVGLLLPCNVTVEEAPSGARVRIADAVTMMGVAGLDEVEAIRTLGADAGARLERVAATLRAG